MNKCTAIAVGLALLAVPAVCSAAPVTMTADDAWGMSSFDTAGSWDSAAAPTAGNDYFNNGYLLRTANVTGGSFTFAGDSLTITGNGIATGVGNDALMYKGGLGIITVDNLVIDGGQLRHGNGNGDTFQHEGNLTIGPSGANNAVFGTGTAYLDGDFFFDLSGAGMTMGDSWVIEGVSRKFYGETFAVNGFTDQGDDTWYLDNGRAEYLFSEADGTLTVVPEPSTLALLGLAGIALAARRRVRG